MALAAWAGHPWLGSGALAGLAAAFLVRVFIIFHDCGHGSFFRSRRANDVIGFIAGMLTLTPYYQWRWEHADSPRHGRRPGPARHRRRVDDDRAGVPRVAPRWKRLAYRLSRNPIVLFVLAPLLLFVIRQRFPARRRSSRERTR